MSRFGWRGQGGRGPSLALALSRVALLALAGCGAASEDDASGGYGAPPGRDWLGGQTGSLTPPRCGLAPSARLQGVSASSGIVVYTSGCTSELALFDAQGNAVPVQTQSLGSGVQLVTPTVELGSGTYTLGELPATADDHDGGADADGDAGLDALGGEVAGAPPAGGETLVVLEPGAAPMRLGELSQPSGSCSAQLELQLDPALVPHVASLALDLRVAEGAPVRIVPFGTLVVAAGGIAHLAVPLTLLPGGGSYGVTLSGELAGSSIEVEPATVVVTCLPGVAPAPRASQREEGAGCSVRGDVETRASPVRAWPVSALLLLFAWRRHRRRRRRRPPD